MNHGLIIGFASAVGVFSFAAGCAGGDSGSEPEGQSTETVTEESTDGCRYFEATLQRHVQSVSQRDLPALEATLTRGDALTLIFPSGTLLPTRREFVDFHREWFASSTWTMRMDPVRTLCTDGMAIALMLTHYEDVDDEGERYFSENYLTLTFARERGRWGLVHDQNTRIRNQRSTEAARPE